MPNTFRGAHAVVTGGTGILGRAVVAALVERGAICHVPSDRESCDDFDLSEHDDVHVALGIDLRSEDAVRRFYSELPEPPWASIQLAGGFSMAAICETSVDDFEALYRLNGVTCFLCCREAVRVMRGNGGGRIVNVGARPAVEPTPGMIAYSASKAMVAAVTTSLAAEVKGDRILVNAVLPSIIDTPTNRQAMPDADFDTWPKPEEIASTIAFLAGRENQLTTGTLLPVYGRS